jgi:hypothetical protein
MRPATIPADLDMSGLARFFQVPHVVEVSTAAFNPDAQFVGSSPCLGDAGSSMLFVPQAATANARERYLFRLCAFALPAGVKARILGLRQAATIAQEIATTAEADSWTSILEREIVSPFWAFSDGNISWHLRVMRGARTDFHYATGLQPSQSQSLFSTDSALLVARPPALLPANGGVPPGDPVGSLGTFRDLRFPWSGRGAVDFTGHEVEGPCIVGLFASVKQTNPLTRPYTPAASVPASVVGLRPEDQFLLAFGNPPGNTVRYRHIGGSIIANTGPIDMPWHKIAAACAEE